MSIAYTFSGFFEQAEVTLKKCLEIAAQNQDLHPTFIGHGCLGVIYLQQGQLEEAEHHLAQSIQLAEAHQVAMYVPFFHAYQAELALLKGDWQAAQIQAENTLQLAKATRQQLAEGEIYRVLSKIQAYKPQSDWVYAPRLGSPLCHARA
jgi:tetratricopeptide (TPR) repeat protein